MGCSLLLDQLFGLVNHRNLLKAGRICVCCMIRVALTVITNIGHDFQGLKACIHYLQREAK